MLIEDINKCSISPGGIHIILWLDRARDKGGTWTTLSATPSPSVSKMGVISHLLATSVLGGEGGHKETTIL